MNKVLLTLIVFLIPVLARAELVTIHVKGMVCGFCAQGIEKKFKALAEVKNVRVDLGTKEVHLDVIDGKSVPDETIKELITSSGYNVEKVVRAK